MKSKAGYSKLDACINEGWELGKNENNEQIVYAYGQEFPVADPLAIHLKVYRTHPSHNTRYDAMFAAFKTLWPQQVKTYNYWMERIFREHVDHETEFFTLASGGGCGKTQTVAYIASLFWLALPKQRLVIVTSTTVESLKSRIYGYILRALNEMAVPMPMAIRNTPPPSINPVPPDFIHGIIGLAAKEGDPEKTIKDIIGRHPKNALLLVLDEAPDMPPAILGAIPNLKKSLADRFQGIALGNARSTTDLHGALSTPHDDIGGWEKLDPNTTFRWKTTQPNGYCLYLNPYDSPAIHEEDPVKRELLSTFLPTAESILKAEQSYGRESEEFWRMTMGFWQSRSSDKTIISKSLLEDYSPLERVQFSGQVPLKFIAGLDPSFSSGGDKCVLRLAVLGQSITGKMILDFRGPELLFPLKLSATGGKSIELQIADQVIRICKIYGVPLNVLTIDASGQGRGLAEVIHLRSKGLLTPIKIYSTNVRSIKKEQQTPDIYITSGYEMWFTGRSMITNKQIYGLDRLAYEQLHTRLFIEKNGKKELESKVDYKRRMAAIKPELGRSPDEADAAMLCVQSAILAYGFYAGQAIALKTYGDEDSRKFDLAIQQYKDKMLQRNQFVLRANYSKGLSSIVNRKLL